MIEFRTLGGVGLGHAGGEEIRSVLAQPKRLALLAYLALARPRGYHRRHTLLALLWPEHDERHGRWNLNQAIRHLRRGLGRDAIVSRGNDEVGLDFEAISLDAAAFEDACEGSREEAALALYRGHLLEGFHISGCADFERWLESERARLRRLAAQAAWSLAEQRAERGDIAAAAATARRAVDLSSHGERDIRRLIELLDRVGDRAGAIRAYENHAAHLRREWNVEPAPETRAAIEAVKSRRETHRTTPSRTPAESRESTDGASRIDDGDADRSKSDTAATNGPLRPRYPIGVATLALVVVVAFVLVGLTTVVGERGRSPATSGAPIGKAGPRVAILPFHVPSPDVAYLSEGMVDLLFANLDGMPGIRPISSLTALARWNERVTAGSAPDLETALGVAASLGARYAVIGSVVAVDPGVRLAASIYETSGGEPLGQANHSAPLDSIWGAVDRLTMDLVRSVDEVNGAGSATVDLRGVTTESPEGLKAFLQAEAHYRRSDFEAAAFEYERAIEADPALSQAHLGLGWSLVWHPLSVTDRAFERPAHWRSALDNAATERQALLARASLTYEGSGMTADMVGELREAVRRDPDDAHLWYLLGEHYLHVGTATGAFDDHALEAERAFGQAVELAPDFIPYRAHLLDIAIIRADERRARELVSDIARRVPPTSLTARLQRNLLRLVFSDSPEEAGFAAALDTLFALDPDEPGRAYVELLGHPRLWPVADAVIEAIRQRAPGFKDCRVRQRALGPGLLTRYLEEAVSPPVSGWCLYLARTLGVAVPEQLFDSAVTAPPDSMSPFLMYEELWVPLYLADRGRWSEHEAVLDERRARWAAALEVDSAGFVARREGYLTTMAEGYAEWRRGHPERALEVLESLPPEGRRYPVARWWLGTLYLELDRPAEAARQFRTLQGAYNTPDWTMASLRLAQAYERLGEAERARAQYSYFVDAWQNADPELQSWVEEGRARLRELAATDR